MPYQAESDETQKSITQRIPTSALRRFGMALPRRVARAVKRKTGIARSRLEATPKGGQSVKGLYRRVKSFQ